MREPLLLPNPEAREVFLEQLTRFTPKAEVTHGNR